MYGKIAQKLIEMADAYQGTGPAETVGAQAGQYQLYLKCALLLKLFVNLDIECSWFRIEYKSYLD